MLAKQKLEYTDFSAGISENIVPGKPNAYARADNLLITRDKHLETRPGSAVYSDTLFYLPTISQRVGGLYNFYNDTSLFSHSGQSFFYIPTGTNPVWTTLNGPTGGPAFYNNTVYSKVSSAQWRQHLYLVSDSGDIPQVVYYDNSETLQLRSAGLPRPVYQSPYTASGLLTAAIGLATSLVSSMISHFGDTGGAGHAHIVADSGGVTALSALALPQTLTQLLAYLATVKTYYNLHITDAQISLPTAQVFHIGKNSGATMSLPTGRLAVLNNLASISLPTPTTLEQAIATLNDLRNMYNLHTYATITHENAVSSLSVGGTYATDSTGYGKFACLTAPVSDTSVVIDGLTIYNPIFVGGLGTLLAYINQVKKEFNTHLGNGGPSTFSDHNNPDTDNPIVVPDATDYLSSVVVLAHLEFFYWWHFQDAKGAENGAGQFCVSFTGTSGGTSPTFTSTSINGSGLVGLYYQPVASNVTWDGWIQFDIFDVDSPVTVISGTSNTVVFSANANVGATNTYRVSSCKYHYDLDSGTGSTTNPLLYFGRVSAYDYTLTSLGSLQLAVTTILGLLKSHQLGSWVASTSGAGTTVYSMQTGQTVNLYSTHYTASSNGFWPESAIPDPANPGFTLGITAAAAYMNTAPIFGTVIYTAIWRYDYTAGGLSFENDSTPALLSQLSVSPSPQNPLPLTTARYPVTLSNLPVLTNSAGDNWDTSNIFLDIYRSITDGTTLFLVGSVPNGTTTFTDAIVDSVLITNQEIYTTGGVLQNDQPPASKYITIMNDTAYYGYVTDITSGEVFPNRILQSISGAPYAVPAENFDDLDDQITGLSNFNNYVVAFCKAKIYRMEGVYDELGNGLLTHQNISPTIGSVSHAGLVQTEYGIFFCGTNGIYWTDGFTLTRVTSELENTYNSLIQSPTQRARINSVYDKATRRIYWSFCSHPTQLECDVAYVLDLNWGISERMSFTTISGGSFSPSAFVLFNNQLIRGTSYGMIFKHDPSYYSDVAPILSQTPSSQIPSTQWAPQPIIYDFQSCQTNFGSSQVKKWVTRVTYQGQAETNLFLQMNRKNNNGGGWQPLTPIRSITDCLWGDPGVVWGQTSLSWGEDGMIDTFRRMPAGSLRCDWMAVQFTNASAIIAGSDTYGVVSVSALVGGSVTLTLPTPYAWPLWSKLYTIAFQNDGYVKQYTITGRTAQTLTISDPGATSPANSTGVLWQMSGVPYGQRFNLTAYNVTYALLADEQSAYHGSTSSDGGANTT